MAWLIVHAQKNQHQEMCATMLPEMVGPIMVPTKHQQLDKIDDRLSQISNDDTHKHNPTHQPRSCRKKRYQTEHPLYAASGTASVLAPSMATMARDYRQQPTYVSEVDGEVVAFHRQNQVRQLKDTCPIDGLCIYNYQLATQVDRIDKFIHLSQNLIASRACD
jgi:hypothetical protein